MVISREDVQKVPSQAIEAAMRADPAKLPAFVGVDLGTQGYVVVRVNKVIPRETPAAEMALVERQQVGQWWGAAESLAYYNLLKQRYKVQIKVPAPAVDKAA
jgi:peptidyl-prolyl cis-trans isomerase D